MYFCCRTFLSFSILIYPENFEQKIGFDRIRRMLVSNCLSEMGKGKVDSVVFQSNFLHISTLLGEVTEFAEILQSEKPFPVDHYHNLIPVLKKIRVEGMFLDVQELFEMRLSLDIVKAILSYFREDEEDEYPLLRKKSREVKMYPFVLDAINKILTTRGKIKDNASRDLSAIRKSLKEKMSRVSTRMQSILKKAREDGIVDEGTELSVRGGRMVIPVRSSDKRRINGLVHDESATGKTSFIEPSDIVEMNNEIKELEYAEKREIIKILIAFSDSIRPYLDEIEYSYDFLGEIDVIRAKAILAGKIGAIQPRITEDREVLWEKAVHPLLFLNFQNSGKKVVPLDIVLNREKHILLISGPNAGGKSVCLQTVGLLQYMLQCGLLVPVSESSRFGIFKKVFLDFGDEQSIENDLSTYSSHLVNMKYFLKNGDSETLFLIDEFGTGTEPLLGGAIAESILGKLREQHSFGVITTHYSNLKHFASGTDGIENGAMLFDHQKMEPQFILQIGKPGSSFAFEIARGIGLPEDILKKASDAVGEEHINFDKHLREIARDKKYWENKRSRIRKSEKKLEDTLEQYERELGELKAERKKILEKARKEAEDLLNGANRKIEGTIKKIREAHAEKESTMKARLELSRLREDVKRPDVSRRDDIDFRQAKVRMEKGKRAFISKEDIPKSELSHDLKPGDKVRMEGQEMAGELMEVHGKNYLVAFGNLITSVSPKKLQKISENEYKTHSHSRPVKDTIATRIQEKKLRFKPVIDLRGKRADEALQMIQEFIDEAIMVEATELSILHGKGTGVLRQMIREFLGSMDVVASFGDEHPSRGGAGITLVKLDF